MVYTVVSRPILSAPNRTFPRLGIGEEGEEEGRKLQRTTKDGARIYAKNQGRETFTFLPPCSITWENFSSLKSDLSK